MELFESVDRPSLEPGLTERLRRIDPRLRVTFSHYAIDPRTSQPLTSFETGEPILHPAQHLWMKADDGSWLHISEFPMERGGFTHLNARFLEIDQCVRNSRNPEEILQRMTERQELARERSRAANRQRGRDRAKANAKRIGDLVFDGKSGTRQAKITSYPGQTNRGTPGDVLSDANEDGWEL